jgi:long-chain acyl-CoA synthetase
MKMPDGKIVIIDRKKNVFKLSQGEFVAPEYLENIFLESVYVEQMYIHGDPLKSFLIAIISPNMESVIQLARDNNIHYTSIQELISLKSIKQLIMRDLHSIGSKQNLQPYQIPKNVLLISDQFTTESGLLTPRYFLMIESHHLL